MESLQNIPFCFHRNNFLSFYTHISSVSVIFKFHSYNKYSCPKLILDKYIRTRGEEVRSGYYQLEALVGTIHRGPGE